MVAGTAEANRTPFDLPEAETELVAGFHTEYSSMRFALLQMAEYVHMITISAVGANLFFGGWMSPVPFIPDSPAWFVLKLLAFLFFFVWLRGTLPRFRYDQLMDFGWKVLVPLATLNLLVTAAVVVALSVTWDAVTFYVAAALALVSAIVVVAQRNPIYSAFALIVTLCSLSAIYGILGASFIAILQVVVYAGAIMVLFLFVLMLLNVRPEERFPGESRRFKLTALALGALLVAQVASVLVRAARPGVAASFDASSRPVARILFSPQYLYVFEATSVLILAALVGAVALARKET